jgi:hypothetical protein
MTVGISLLNAMQIQRMVQSINCDRPLVLFLGEWLTSLNLFSDAQVYAILKWVKTGICEYDDNEKAVKFVFVVSDSRWVSCTPVDKAFFDAETFNLVEEIPHRPLTHIVCDIVQLRARMHRLQERSNANARTGEQSASSVDQASE